MLNSMTLKKLTFVEASKVEPAGNHIGKTLIEPPPAPPRAGTQLFNPFILKFKKEDNGSMFPKVEDGIVPI